MAQYQCNHQQDLTDAFYGEIQMTDELTDHIESCLSCKAHWESMQQIQASLEAELELMTIDYKVDTAVIRQAFKKADELNERKHNQHQFILFVIIALFILSMMATLVVTGNTNILLYEQIFVTVLGLVSMPVLIRYRLKRGW